MLIADLLGQSSVLGVHEKASAMLACLTIASYPVDYQDLSRSCGFWQESFSNRPRVRQRRKVVLAQRV